jgi:hypothetical protein
MPLTKAQAEKLDKVIRTENMQERMVHDKDEWDKAFSGVPTWSQQASYDDLQDKLIEVRKNSLDRKTVVVNVDDKSVRVYPLSEHNIDSDVDDIFARGLDSARAVTEILKHHPNQMSQLGVNYVEDVTDLLNKFQSNMKVHRDNPDKAQEWKMRVKSLRVLMGLWQIV